MPTPVGRWAADAGFRPVLTPDRLGGADFIETLRSLGADVYVVIAFRILPESVFTIPRYAFNLHASLLPAFRGAAPIQRAIMAGETQTGVTTFLLQTTVDTGAILRQRAVEILPEENFVQLAGRLARIGAETVIETLDLLASGDFRPSPQDESRASPAPKIGPADRRLDFADGAALCVNRVRALSPEPGALIRHKDQVLIVLALRDAGPGVPGDRPGDVVLADPKRGIIIATADRRLSLELVQPPAKRPQTGAEFVRGHRIEAGDHLEPVT